MFTLEIPNLYKKEQFYYVKGSKHRITIPKLGPELALFVGMIYGDGWLVSRPKDLSKGRWGIGLVEGDIEVVGKFINLGKDLFNLNFKLYVKKRKSYYYEVRANSRILYEFLFQNFELLGGFKSKIIKTPKIIKQNCLIEPFFKGLFSTDGSLSKKILSYSTISIDMITEIEIFLKNNGFNPKINIQLKDRKNPLYTLRIRGFSELFQFEQLIGISGKKDKLLKEIINHNFRGSPVLSIAP